MFFPLVQIHKIQHSHHLLNQINYLYHILIFNGINLKYNNNNEISIFSQEIKQYHHNYS
jgi:hypothetical protein